MAWGKVLRRFSPISLEFGVKVFDYGDVLDHEDLNPEPQQSELSASIDDLLNEIDVSCADFESEQDSANKVASDSVSEVVSPTAEVEGAEEPSAEPVAESGAESDEEIGEAALEALDAVSENAEALLEDSIGDLLDELDGVQDQVEPGVLDEAEAEAGTEGEGDDDDPLAGIADDLIGELTDEDEDIEAADSVIDAGEDLIDEDFLSEIAGDEEPVETADGVEGETESGLGSELEDELDELNDDVAEEVVDEVIAEHDVDAEAEDAAESIEGAVEDIAQDSVDAVSVEAVVDGDEDQATDPEAADADNQMDMADHDIVLGDLDDALASVGDDLLMGDFESPDGEIDDADSMTDSIDPSMLLDQLNLSDEGAADAGTGGVEATPKTEALAGVEESDAGSDPTPIEAAGANETSEAPAPVVDPDLETIDTMLEEIPEDEKAIESMWEMLLHTAQTHGKAILSAVIAGALPMSAKGLMLLSKPLASKSVQVRNAVGLIALWTIFLASILLIYSMFFRVTPTPTPSQAPTRVVAPGESLEPIVHQMVNEIP